MDDKTYLAILRDYPNLRKYMIGDMTEEEFLRQNPPDLYTPEEMLREKFEYLENVAVFTALEKQYPAFKQIRSLGDQLSHSHTPQEALALADQVVKVAKELEASLNQTREENAPISPPPLSRMSAEKVGQEIAALDEARKSAHRMLQQSSIPRFPLTRISFKTKEDAAEAWYLVSKNRLTSGLPHRGMVVEFDQLIAIHEAGIEVYPLMPQSDEEQRYDKPLDVEKIVAAFTSIGFIKQTVEE